MDSIIHVIVHVIVNNPCLHRITGPGGGGGGGGGKRAIAARGQRGTFKLPQRARSLGKSPRARLTNFI